MLVVDDCMMDDFDEDVPASAREQQTAARPAKGGQHQALLVYDKNGKVSGVNSLSFPIQIIVHKDLQ